MWGILLGIVMLAPSWVLLCWPLVFRGQLDSCSHAFFRSTHENPEVVRKKDYDECLRKKIL